MPNCSHRGCFFFKLKKPVFSSRWTGDHHPQEEWAKFGYRGQTRWLKTFLKFCLVLATYMNSLCKNKKAISNLFFSSLKIWPLLCNFFPQKIPFYNSQWISFLSPQSVKIHPQKKTLLHWRSSQHLEHI